MDIPGNASVERIFAIRITNILRIDEKNRFPRKHI